VPALARSRIGGVDESNQLGRHLVDGDTPRHGSVIMRSICARRPARFPQMRGRGPGARVYPVRDVVGKGSAMIDLRRQCASIGGMLVAAHAPDRLYGWSIPAMTPHNSTSQAAHA